MNERAVLQRTFQQLTSVRVVKKRQLEMFFKDRSHEIELIAAAINSGNTASSYTNSIILPTSAVLKHLQSLGYFDRLLIMGKDKKGVRYDITTNRTVFYESDIQWTKDKPVFASLYNRIMQNNGTIISDFTYEWSPPDVKVPSLYIASPLNDDNGKPAGFVAVQISLNAINEIMLENSPNSGLGQSGESYLVGPDYLMRSTSRFKANSVLNTRVKTYASQQALKGVTATKVADDYRGIKVFSSFGPLNIKGLHWAILAEIDYHEAMVAVFRARNDILYISILVSLIIIGLSAFFASRIISPIRRLKDATNLVEKGNYDVHIEMDTSDEVGKLVTAFNNMTRHIKAQTKELKNREERLSHFYNATSDGIVLHANGKPLLFNKALQDLTGYSNAELMQMNLSEIIIRKNSLANSHLFEAHVITKSKGTFPAEVQESAIDYKNEKVNACVIRDITKRKQIEKALESERKKRLSAVFDGQEHERQRLSRELHDGLGQSMIALSLMMENTSLENSREAGKRFTAIKQSLNNLIAEVRQISGNLMPPVLIELGLETGVKQLCRNMNRSAGISINFDSEGQYNDIDLKSLTYLYRIAQEALTNAIKHAGASEINVQLLEHTKSISLIIEDNGKGFDSQNIPPDKGNGIFNMRERIKILNGQIEIISKKQKGTLINARVPKTGDEKKKL
jgi:PAS domain S-box-containing protein